jgi:transposase
VVVVAHALLRTVYHVLATGQEYRDLGPDYYEHRDVDRAKASSVHALERLGVKVTVEAVA